MFKVYGQLQANFREQAAVDSSLEKLRSTLDDDLGKLKSEFSRKIHDLEIGLAQSRERFVPEASHRVEAFLRQGGQRTRKVTITAKGRAPTVPFDTLFHYPRVSYLH